MPARFWLDLTTEDVRAGDRGRAIAVLPVAAVEQHGPHLPVGVDAVIAEGYLARMAALVPDDLDVLVLPVQAIGASDEHRAFPGTLTLSPRPRSEPGPRSAKACAAPAFSSWSSSAPMAATAP